MRISTKFKMMRGITDSNRIKYIFYLLAMKHFTMCSGYSECVWVWGGARMGCLSIRKPKKKTEIFTKNKNTKKMLSKMCISDDFIAHSFTSQFTLFVQSLWCIHVYYNGSLKCQDNKTIFVQTFSSYTYDTPLTHV